MNAVRSAPKLRAKKAVSSHSMASSGTRTCSNSGSSVIAVVSSAKDIILRSY